MKADRSSYMIMHVVIAVVVALLLSFTINDTELGQLAALVVGVVIYVFCDIRSRLIQIHDAAISRSFNGDSNKPSKI